MPSHSQRNAGADTTHQTDQIFRVLSVPADGTSAAKLIKRRFRYAPVLWAALGQASSACLCPWNMGARRAKFNRGLRDMGARRAKFNRGLRIYLCVQANELLPN
jgi:hypothetical protein